MPEYFKTIRGGEDSIESLTKTINTASSNAIKPFAAQARRLVQTCLDLARQGVHKAVITREQEEICSCSLIAPNLQKAKGHLDLRGQEINQFVFETKTGKRKQINQRNRGTR